MAAGDFRSDDLPVITGNAYTTARVSMDTMNSLTNWTGAGTDLASVAEAVGRARRVNPLSKELTFAAARKEDTMAIAQKEPKLRVVRVFLADTDVRVPVEKRMIYASDEMTTDATDEELFFSIAVKDLLDAHNKARAEVKWEEDTDTGTKERTGLKPLRIRELSMQVTTVAQF